MNSTPPPPPPPYSAPPPPPYSAPAAPPPPYAPATAPIPDNVAANARREAWRVSLPGLWLVAQLELRQRVRSTKWKWALGTAAALIGGVTLLMWGALNSMSGDDSGTGDITFGLVVYFVLFLGLVISPTLSATTINGDVRDGTLAPLQATGLSAADIVLGKLLASWIASLAFLAVAIPFILFSYVDGGMPALAMLTVTIVLAAELLVVCALGLGWSAVTARTPSSAVLTFTTVAVLSVVLPIVFGLLTVAVTEEVTVTTSREVYYYDEASAPEGAKKNDYGDYYVCEDSTYESTVARTDKIWWLLAVNPYVVVADSAPSPKTIDEDYSEAGPLEALKEAVREARLGPRTYNDYCGDEVSDEEIERRDDLGALPPVWPWGLAGQALLAMGAVALAVRRVAVPYGKLPTGSRVA